MLGLNLKDVDELYKLMDKTQFDTLMRSVGQGSLLVNDFKVIVITHNKVMRLTNGNIVYNKDYVDYGFIYWIDRLGFGLISTVCEGYENKETVDKIIEILKKSTYILGGSEK